MDSPREFLIFKGSFPLAPWATSISVLGLLMTAVFLLTVIQKVFSGPVNPQVGGDARPDHDASGWRCCRRLR